MSKTIVHPLKEFHLVPWASLVHRKNNTVTLTKCWIERMGQHKLCIKHVMDSKKERIIEIWVLPAGFAKVIEAAFARHKEGGRQEGFAKFSLKLKALVEGIDGE